jgi:pyruvate/2-oxoglutarate dehydrogenase complex dihydrolipoamide dehydrogenase (E3) component
MTVDYDGVIIGGTVQGRKAASLAAREGARVALVEPVGAVERQLHRQIGLGVLAQADGASNWVSLKAQIKALEAVAYPHLSLDCLASSGVDVVPSPAQFSPRPKLAVTTLTRRLRSRGYLLAPDTEVTVPDIPGLAETPYLTLDTLLDLEQPPESAIVLGRSSTAIALAQALARLGTRTTLVSRGNALLPTEDADISAFIAALLEADGVALRLGSTLDKVRDQGGGELSFTSGDRLAADHLILATASHPALADLNLGSIGIRPSLVGNTPQP